VLLDALDDVARALAVEQRHRQPPTARIWLGRSVSSSAPAT
jgi:hypothetical protein